MGDNKLSTFQDCFDISFKDVARQMAGFEFTSCNRIEISEEKRFSVIIGTVGKYKGRILFQTGAAVVKDITEGMNGEPLDDTADTYLYIAEFANTFCGNAITKINNIYKDSELRLTPPAILSGASMKITTPSIESSQIYLQCAAGPVILNIGFEGV